MAEKYGFIITVEEYRGDIPTVEYACADGDLVYDMFVNKLGVVPDNIRRLSNTDFTCASFREEFSYHLSQLSTDAVLYFYYAGHGFFADGKNYLTTYETSLFNLIATSISFEDVILDGFRKSPATTFIAFIDACAQGLSDNSRSIITRGFGYHFTGPQFNRDGFTYAIYFACSPEEKAYPSDKLKHGIWTWHLCNAFEHNDNAFNLQPRVTAESLKEYLHRSVLAYIESYPEDAPKKQSPYAIISSNNDITIFELPQKGSSFEDQLAELERDFFLNCFVADMEYCIVNYMDPDGYDYTNATAVCNYLSKQLNLSDNWQEIVNKLQFYSSCIKRNERILLSLDEQIEILDDVNWLVDSLFIDVFK